MVPNTPRFCPEMKTRRGFAVLLPRYALIDIGALDLTACDSGLRYIVERTCELVHTF